MIYKIYRLISPSGKSYIGYTKNGVASRFEQHVQYYKRWLVDRERKKSTKLCFAFEKYDPSLWTFEIVYETKDRSDALAKEDEFIQKYNSIDEGYNTIPGGFGGKGKKLTDEHRQKLSEARKKFYETEAGKKDLEEKSRLAKENNPSKKGREAWNKGISHTEETKNKIRKTSKEFYATEEGKKLRSELTKQQWKDGVFDNRPKRTEEQIRIHAERMKGRKQSEHQKKRASEIHSGKIVSEETRAKMSASKKGKKLSLVTCPHCGKEGAGGSMQRFHFDNCKFRKD